MPRTRGIIINSPSNPTGAVYSTEVLAALAKVLVGTNIWVLSDDVYEHIVYDGPAPHILKIEPELRQQGIVFNSLSKTYAMTGWRVGFAAGPGEVIAAAWPSAEPEQRQPDSIAQFAAVEALAGPRRGPDHAHGVPCAA